MFCSLAVPLTLTVAIAGCLAGFASAICAAEDTASTHDAGPQAFFAAHCYDCHSAGETGGGLDLEQFSGAFATREERDRWTQIFDRIDHREMPPADAAQPSPAERDALLRWLQPRLETADRTERQVIQRRLNRREYQNTIRDLLLVEVPVEDLLPEDQQAGGFDNNGEALAISTEQMGGYLAAAQLAIDAAMVHGPRPEEQTFTVSAMHEVERYLGQSFALVDDRIVSYTSTNTQYSKVSTRGKRLPEAGRYRFRFTAATHRSQEKQVFTVVASDFASVGAVFKNLGYFEVGPEPEVFEIEAELDKKFAIQFFVLGLPTWLKDPIDGDHPGIGFSPVEITGPLTDQWPPASHTRLLGDVDLSQGSLDDAERILRDFLPRAFRRPASEDEVQRYLSLVKNRLETGRSFEQSLKIGLVAVLCSPNFLYLREDVRPGTTRINDYELASRLSYFLHRSTPDAQLLQLAAADQLHEPAVLRAQVERLLSSPRREQFITDFVGQWLQLRKIDDTSPDKKLYPEFEELLKISMVGEGEAFFRKLLDEDLDVANFLDSDFAMLNQRLAEHYGIEGVQGLQIRAVELPAESVRGGVLTQGGVLKVTANGTTTSPVTRGVWVLENILGHPTPPPPPNVGGIEPDIRGATTIREQLAKHRDVATCSSCHRHIDPPGFALESFDPVGKLRSHYRHFIVNPDHADKGWGRVKDTAEVDASGVLSSGETFADIREFKRLLLTQREPFSRCLAEKLTTYALGRELGFSDREAIRSIVEHTLRHGNGLRSLVHAIVQSPAFQQP
ncbi:DUF1592 domain-containing protein [Lignipirellula cremea]|uniref:DUF1592 domain-containing protein n=1 Tax=Lignipirellula cremea TaxID=2528010 RepID=UPI0018D213CE|nr:DUF1592 domain-containing protein [Lignipirellula cremea]